MHRGKECIPFQCIILKIILGVIEVKVLCVNPDCYLERKPKQPLEVLHLFLILLRLLEVGIGAVKHLHEGAIWGFELDP